MRIVTERIGSQCLLYAPPDYNTTPINTLYISRLENKRLMKVERFKLDLIAQILNIAREKITQATAPSSSLNTV